MNGFGIALSADKSSGQSDLCCLSNPDVLMKTAMFLLLCGNVTRCKLSDAV